MTSFFTMLMLKAKSPTGCVGDPRLKNMSQGQQGATNNMDGYFLSVTLNVVPFPGHYYILSKSRSEFSSYNRLLPKCFDLRRPHFLWRVWIRGTSRLSSRDAVVVSFGMT